MSAKREIEKKDPADIPEVKEYMDMLSAWEAFKNDTTQIQTSVSAVMERVGEYVNKLETLRSRADKAVRAAGVSCGPFTMIQNNLKIDWDKVHAGRGREGFIQVGGSIVEKNTCKGDVNRYLAAKAKGLITPEEAKEYETDDHKFKKIDPYNVP